MFLLSDKVGENKPYLSDQMAADTYSDESEQWVERSQNSSAVELPQSHYTRAFAPQKY